MLARVVCPRGHEPAAVRIGQDPVDHAPAVVWCERFPAGRIECDRGCFTCLESAPERAALLEPA